MCTIQNQKDTIMATKKKKKEDAASADKPTLVSLLAEAGRGYAVTMKGLVRFCTAYVAAIDLYGQEGRNAFREKYALYTCADLESLEMFGRGSLIPQFAFCSSNMKRGILRLENSLDKQMQLAGFVKNGKIEVVNSSGKVVLKSLEDLSKLEEDSILFALKEGGNPNELRKFAYFYRKEFALRTSSKPNVEIVGDFLVVNRKTKLSREEVQQWLARMP